MVATKPSSSTTKTSLASAPKQAPKKAGDFSIDTPAKTKSSSIDDLLQGIGTRRHYMRRASKCPSMLMVSASKINAIDYSDETSSNFQFTGFTLLEALRLKYQKDIQSRVNTDSTK
jgi:hypothetical protein